MTPEPADGRYAAMWSGGKDSALAVARARADGYRIDRFVTFYDPATGRIRFHETPISLVAAQADAAGAELDARPTAWQDMGAEFRRLLDGLAAAGYQGLVFGDIHLADVRAWYEEQVLATRLKHVEPVWGEAPANLLDEYVSGGGRAVVTCCDTERLDAGWLGRIIDETFLRDLARIGIDACGENGEYHTFAFLGPPLARAVAWRPGSRESDGRFQRLLLEPG
jgi:uncharacterized protein (TIGR00290 family)